MSNDLQDVMQSSYNQTMTQDEFQNIKYTDKYGVLKAQAKGNTFEINDIIRYKYTSDPEIFTEKFKSAIANLNEKGYNIVRVKNTWRNNTNPYKGINTIVQAGYGQKFEIQYHTFESFELKNGKMHELYEKQRLIIDDESKEYISLRNQMFELSDKLTVPKNIEKVEDV